MSERNERSTVCERYNERGEEVTLQKKPILIVAEHNGHSIHPITYELMGKGKELAKQQNLPLAALALAPPKVDLQELSFRGANNVFFILHECFASPDELLYEQNMAAAMRNLEPEVILIGATPFGRSLAPRLAAILETGLTADCTDLKMEEGHLVQIRPAFSENILAHIQTETKPQMATVRYKEFAEAERNEKEPSEMIELQTLETVGHQAIKTERISDFIVDITEAPVVVSGGRGLKKAEDFKLLQALADALGGMLGGSRAVVEEGFISKDHQVGYSGHRVKPVLYVACGISGAPQHLAGMKEAEMIIAINSDPSAPIFQIADYGIVGDLYEVIPKLISEISR